MGLNNFASPNVDPDKSPIEPKIHFTYTNKNESLFDHDLNNVTLDQQSLWEAYGDVMTSIAFYHLVRLVFHLLEANYS